MRTLYLDLSYGISGDMAVAALYELADESLKKEVQNVLDKLNLTGMKAGFSRRQRGALDCQSFDVILEEDNHDHDVRYLHGNLDKAHEHDHAHEHPHDHDHGHEHHHHVHEHGHSHVHRNLADVTAIIDNSPASTEAKTLAVKIFTIVAKAEAKAHGKPLSEVHFHEVGALDSIADILAFAVLYTGLKIDKTVIDNVAEGFGQVRCQHGILTIPVPAVVNILTAHQLPLKFTAIEGELITPTGAAIAAAIRDPKAQTPQHAVLKASGLGAGKRDYAVPTYVRALLLEDAALQEIATSLPGERSIIKAECNIDDSTPEALGYLLEKLYAAGALEAFYTPILMKKCRPGTLVTVICEEDKLSEIKKALFIESTTIGVRYCAMERTVLPREIIRVSTPYGEALFKKVSFKEAGLCQEGIEESRCYPEYESIRELAKAGSLSFHQALKLARSALDKSLG